MAISVPWRAPVHSRPAFTASEAQIPVARMRLWVATLATLALVLGGCALSGGGAGICASAGGTYAGGTCTQAFSPALQAAEQSCDARGGVFLAGQNVCAFGMGR